MKKKWLSLMISILLLAACSKETQDPPMTRQQRAEANAQLNREIVQAENEFGMRLHRLLTEQGDGGNLVISPYSISTALTLAYNGSSGDMSKEIAKTLGLDDWSLLEVNETNRLLQSLLENGDQVTVEAANSIWVQEGLKLKQPFLQSAESNYEAEVREVDLTDDSSVKAVNRWAEKHTHGKIPALLEQPPGGLAMLINAVYFKGRWMNEFNAGNTVEEDFFLPDGTSIRVQMMHTQGSFDYKETEDWKAIRIPYGDGRMNMLIILPSPKSSLDKLHEQLWKDIAVWQNPAADYTTVKLGMPRFKVENKLELGEALKRLGMGRAMNPDQSDFTQMTDSKPFYISGVMHNTFLNVDEKGTEAAAITEVFMAGSAPPKDPIEMTINRPFFFAIEDRESGAWIFAGSITNPI